MCEVGYEFTSYKNMDGLFGDILYCIVGSIAGL
jgi:hypothetical protein